MFSFICFLPLLSKLYYKVLLLVYVGTVSLHVVSVFCNAQFQKPSAVDVYMYISI